MKKSKDAFSLVIAIGLVMITIILAIIIVEYMIPFSRNIRGVENATVSYYLAYSGIENGLFYFKGRHGEKEGDDTSYRIGEITDSGYTYFTNSSGTIIPTPGKGNSQFNSDWNTISMGDSIQLSVGYNFLSNNIGNIGISFRVPDLNEDGLPNEKLLGGLNDIVISWQISTETETLSALPDQMITIGDINKMTSDQSELSLATRNGRKIESNDPIPASTFFASCGDGQKCILRFSVVNPIKQFGTEISVPFLEWKINSKTSLPLRYSRIESIGNSYGFSRILNVRYPQDTIPESLDFAIFQ